MTLLSVFATLSIMVANAQGLSCVDTPGHQVQIKIYFPYDESHIDSNYMDNIDNMRQIDTLLRDSSYISTLRRIEVTAQSSPEGTVRYNAALSERRRQSLERYFTTHYPEIDHALWDFRAVAENWELFHNDLAADVNIPQYDKVISISSSSRDQDAKEWLLKKLDGGKPWSYIKEHILPSHRFGAGVVFIPISATPIAQPLKLKPRSYLTTPKVDIPTYATTNTRYRKPLLAIKTNLVYDLVSALNIELEVPIGQHFSVTGELINPWWYSVPAKYTMRAHMFTAGGKYWLGDRSKREALTGWAVGANIGYSQKFDLQRFNIKGVQGTYFMAGATVGYAHTIYKNLHMEYQLGLGATRSDYKNYTMAYGTEHGDIKVFDYPWITKRKTIIGPTQLRVSLAYMLLNNKRTAR